MLKLSGSKTDQQWLLASIKTFELLLSSEETIEGENGDATSEKPHFEQLVMDANDDDNANLKDVSTVNVAGDGDATCTGAAHSLCMPSNRGILQECSDSEDRKSVV